MDFSLISFDPARPPKIAERSQPPQTMAKKGGAMADLAFKEAPPLVAPQPPDPLQDLQMTSPQVLSAVWVRASQRLARFDDPRPKSHRRTFSGHRRSGSLPSAGPLRSSLRATAVHRRHGRVTSAHVRRLASFLRSLLAISSRARHDGTNRKLRATPSRSVDLLIAHSCRHLRRAAGLAVASWPPEGRRRPQ